MSRRDQIIMTGEEVARYLNDKATIVLNSIGRDGVPHPTPMWFAVEDDGAILMTTFTKSQKIQNLKRDPRVTLLLEDGTVYAEMRGVIFHGVAELHRDTDFVMRIIREINARDNDAGTADGFSEAEQAGMRASAEKRTAMRVRPTKVVSWDHRKLGGVY